MRDAAALVGASPVPEHPAVVPELAELAVVAAGDPPLRLSAVGALGPPPGELPHVVVQLAEDLAGDCSPVIGGPAPYYRAERGENRRRVRAAQCAHLIREPFAEPPDGRIARHDQQLSVTVTAHVEPQEIEPLGEVHDLGLVLVEDKAPGREPFRELRLDLLGLLPGMAAGDQVIGVPDHDGTTGPGIPGTLARGDIPDPCGLLQPVERHVQHQWTDDTALGGSLPGRREYPVLDHPGPQPSRDHVPGGERPERFEKPPVLNSVERRRQVGIHDPHALAPAFQRGEQRCDRVGAAASRPEPVRAGFEPGLPLRLQRVPDPCLVAAVGQRGNTERTAFSVGFRHIHAPDRQRLPGADGLVHSHRRFRPGPGCQGYFPVDPRGPAPSIPLCDLPNTD